MAQNEGLLMFTNIAPQPLVEYEHPTNAKKASELTKTLFIVFPLLSGPAALVYT